MKKKQEKSSTTLSRFKHQQFRIIIDNGRRLSRVQCRENY